MTEGLDEFPEELRDTDTYPWDLGPAPIVWQWGADLGKRLDEIDSKELLRKRRWLERDPAAFADLIQAIDEILTQRGGEI